MSNQTHYIIRYRTGLIALLGLYLCAMLLSTGVLSLDIDHRSSGASDDAIGQLILQYGAGVERIGSLIQRSTHSWVAQLILLIVCLLLPRLSVVRAAVVAAVAGLLLLGWHIAVMPQPHDLRIAACLGWLLFIWLGYVGLKLVESWRGKRLVQAAVRKYAPAQLTDHYYRNPEALDAQGELRELTIMFCDMHQFTRITERLEPKQLPKWLNQYFSVVSSIVEQHGGTVDKYMGDSVMAFWGAPGHSDTHAQDALAAGVEILEAVEALSARVVNDGLPPIRIGIGIATGLANVGNLGAENRMTYTVVGDAVNIADRLQRETRKFNTPIIVNDLMTERVPEYLFRSINWIKLKGRRRQVRIFDPVCHQSEASPDTHRELQLHRKAMQFMHGGQLADAEKLFMELRKTSTLSPDGFYDAYLQLFQERRESPGVEPDPVDPFVPIDQILPSRRDQS